MGEYTVPHNYERWTSKIPIWLAWTIIITIGGGLAEVLAPYITFMILEVGEIGFFVLLSILLFTYCIVISSIKLIGLSIIGYKITHSLRLLIAWIPFSILTFFIAYRDDADTSISVYISYTFMGFFVGIWAALWLLKVLPRPMPVNDKSIWISVYALSFAAGFLFLGLAVASGPMRDPKVFHVFDGIYYFIQLAKWLIVALPTGMLFQWMLRRQLAEPLQ